MSQGELFSLALAPFLPRATLPERPFRFLLIDDPVQSMDPATVHAVAAVLAEVAERRQVVVFTHDDRLPAAVRHLQLPARIITVDRAAQSQVLLAATRNGTPAGRYLNDARAVAYDTQLDPALLATVIGNLVRETIEATCHDLIRARGYREGRRSADLDADLARERTTRELLALALLGDERRTSGPGRGRPAHGREVEPGMRPRELLDEAESLMVAPPSSMRRCWARAVASLTRTALERGLDEYWSAAAPSVAGRPMRHQLLVLPQFVGKADAMRARAAWHGLCHAVHHHAYELAPTLTELRDWHRQVARVLSRLDEDRHRSA